MRRFSIVAILALMSAAGPARAQTPEPGQISELAQVIHRAVATHHASLLGGTPLPANARVLWFIADDQGNVIEHGVRESLPATVRFSAIPAILPELSGRAYTRFSLSSAAESGPGRDVSVLWVVLRKV